MPDAETSPDMPDPRLLIPRNVPPGWLWHPRAEDFCETYGIDREIVESAAEHPSQVYVDPMSAVAGYLLVGRRRGDVVAICSYRETIRRGEPPMIVYARVVLPLQVRYERHAPGSTTGSKVPTSLVQLRRAILRDGMCIDRTGKHEVARSPDGVFLASLPLTPSDHRTIPNTWQAYVRNRDVWLTQQRVKRGDLLNRRAK